MSCTKIVKMTEINSSLRYFARINKHKLTPILRNNKEKLYYYAWWDVFELVPDEMKSVIFTVYTHRNILPECITRASEIHGIPKTVIWKQINTLIREFKRRIV